MNAALQSSVTALPRNVYKLRGTIIGRNAYFAVTSGGVLIGNCIYLVSEDENDAQLVRRLRVLLEAADPKLRLLPRTVVASIDGPSHGHPELTLIESEQGDDVSVPPEADLAGADPITRDVYRRLYALLHDRTA